MHSLTNSTLKKFGLNNNEIKVYLECLKKDEITPFQISKLTQIPRTTVYDVLMGLSLKGLVELEQSDGFTKQQTLVKAKNPSVLREILQQKRRELTSLEVDVVQILPDLKEDFHKDNSSADFKFYPGIEGARKIYFDTSAYEMDLELLTWDIQMPMDAFGLKEGNKVADNYNEWRKRKKIPEKEITPLNDWTKHVISYQYQRNPDYLSQKEYRYLESPAFNIYQWIQIYGNYISIICAHKEEAWGLKIKSPSFVETMRSIFMANWEFAKPLTKDIIDSWGENAFLKEEKAKKKRKY